MTIHHFDGDQLNRALPWHALITALRDGFCADYTIPLRHHHTVDVPHGSDATLLLMPAWQTGRYLGIKSVTVFPDNAKRDLPAVQGLYQLCDGMTGVPLATMSGDELTARRTAAASALASSYLSRADARHLLMVGTGRLSINLIAAHCAVRPISQVSVWGRNPEKAAKIVQQATALGVSASVQKDLATGCSTADIISTATLAHEPLIHGKWLRYGTHLDLVGGFRPTMREADDECVRRSLLFVDTREGALGEAGDLVQPLESGLIDRSAIKADLFELCRGAHPGRQDAESITLFKSVGTALEDLVAAVLAYETLRQH